MKVDEVYSVAMAGQKRVNIINARNGAVVNSFTVQGNITHGPIVAGNQCTYVVQYTSGEKRGFIRKLPSGVVTNSFQA